MFRTINEDIRVKFAMKRYLFWKIDLKSQLRDNKNAFWSCVSGYCVIRSLHGRPFAGRATNWESNKLGCYITTYSPIARSVVLRWRNQTIIDLLGNVFIHNAARSRLSPQMAKPCKERIMYVEERFRWRTDDVQCQINGWAFTQKCQTVCVFCVMT